MANQLENNQILKQALETAIKAVQNRLEGLKKKEPSVADSLLENAALNNSINTFSINTAYDKLMRTLTHQIETIFNNCLKRIPDDYRQYIFNLLFDYHYDHKTLKFNESISMDSLHSFLNDLEATRDSIDAFEAAWNGDMELVREFVRKHPELKNKPGLWGTTLLYSAARNDHLKLVEYLISDANCNVNAQNQQHFQRASRLDTIHAPDYQVNPRWGSTALHAACFHGHLAIVKYLVEHGADCYIRNQAEETPIMNIEDHSHIREYFKSILNTGYSKDTLPEKTILEGNGTLEQDCIWEYKPFSENIWYPFKLVESRELHKALIITDDQQLKHEICLNESSTIYTVSITKFLRSEEYIGKDTTFAWVRCRGSSILNFDCYALWQIFLTKHPQSNVQDVSYLEVFDLPTMVDPSFRIHLYAWYNCDAQTGSLLDKAMNNHQQHITLAINHVSDDELQIDLKSFSLSNKQGTISGFLRWIPKLILKTEENKCKSRNIDNFEISMNTEVIPLTTRLLKRLQTNRWIKIE